MKILINLFSEQTMPNLIAIRHVRPDNVIALATKEFVNQKQFFESLTGIPHTPIAIEAYMLENNINIITNFLEKTDSSYEVILNYTGGTKIMTLSAIIPIILSKRIPVKLLYINTLNKLAEWTIINGDGSIKSTEEKIIIQINFSDYVILKNEKIKSFEDKISGNEKERYDLSKNMLTSRMLSPLFQSKVLRSMFDNDDRHHHPKKSFSFKSDKLSLYWNTEKFNLNASADISYSFTHNDAGLYFTGGWLEEYIYLSLKRSKDFDSVLKNVCLEYKTNDKYLREFDKNELDIVVTKGIRSLIIECKAGSVSQDNIYKLNQVKNYFLGTFGLAVLVTKYKPQPNIIEKCKDLNIKVICGFEIQGISKLIKNLM